MDEEPFDTYDFFFKLSINLFNSALYYLLGKFIWRLFFFLLIIPFLNVTVDFIYTIIFFIKKIIKLTQKIKKYILEKLKRAKKKEKIKLINNLVINEFKKWILKEIIYNLNYKFKKEENFFDIFKKAEKNSYLLKEIDKSDFDFLKKIEKKGWYVYDSDNSEHRRILFTLLSNYFNFFSNGYFNKFIRSKWYGIYFEGSIDEYKVYFYLYDSSIPSFDPVVTILYLLNQINLCNKGKMGNLQLKIFPFINK